MMSATPFRFERDFDMAPLKIVTKAAPPKALELEELLDGARRKAVKDARLAHEQELATARQAAQEAGREIGRTEGEAAALERLEARTAELLATIDAALPALRQTQAERIDGFANDIEETFALVLRKLLPGLEDRLGAWRLETFLGEAVRAAPAGLAIRVASAPTEKHIVGMVVAGLRGRLDNGLAIELADDPGLAPGAVSVTWSEGGMVLDPSEIARAVTSFCDDVAPCSLLAEPPVAALAPPSSAARARPKRKRREPPAPLDDTSAGALPAPPASGDAASPAVPADQSLAADEPR